VVGVEIRCKKKREERFWPLVESGEWRVDLDGGWYLLGKEAIKRTASMLSGNAFKIRLSKNLNFLFTLFIVWME